MFQKYYNMTEDLIFKNVVPSTLDTFFLLLIVSVVLAMIFQCYHSHILDDNALITLKKNKINVDSFRLWL